MYRRVGGLEKYNDCHSGSGGVYRRVGGLEKPRCNQRTVAEVYRRVGGLESRNCGGGIRPEVYRRIGGLWNSKGELIKIECITMYHNEILHIQGFRCILKNAWYGIRSDAPIFGFAWIQLF